MRRTKEGMTWTAGPGTKHSPGPSRAAQPQATPPLLVFYVLGESEPCFLYRK